MTEQQTPDLQPTETPAQAAPQEPSPPEDPQADAASAHLQSTLAQREARVKELEATLTEARSSLATSQRDASHLRDHLTQAIAKYRQALLEAHPSIPQDLVAGQTVPELEESLERANQIVEEVRNRLEAEAQTERVPTGSPPRRAPDLSSLSPQEKIAYGLKRG